MSVCEVLNCPAMAEPLQATCGPHKIARTAKELHIAKSKWTGKGGESCILCGKIFVETDWVGKHRVKHPTKKGDHRGYAHVDCGPAPVKRHEGPIETPLFGDARA